MKSIPFLNYIYTALVVSIYKQSLSTSGPAHSEFHRGRRILLKRFRYNMDYSYCLFAYRYIDDYLENMTYSKVTECIGLLSIVFCRRRWSVNLVLLENKPPQFGQLKVFSPECVRQCSFNLNLFGLVKVQSMDIKFTLQKWSEECKKKHLKLRSIGKFGKIVLCWNESRDSTTY